MGHILSFCCSAIGPPSIGTNRFQKIVPFFGCGSTSEPLQIPLDGLCRSIVYHLHVGKTRVFLPLTISIKRYGAENGALSLAPSSWLRPLGSEKRFIHFYQTRKTISGISICHRFANLVSHQPRCPVLRDIKKPLHPGYRHFNFVYRHMIDPPIPLHQRRPSAVKNGSCRHTCLESTHFTVEQVPLGKIPGFLMSTPWANKSIWLSLLCKVLRTRFIIWKFLLELYQTTLFVFLGHLSICPRIYLTWI